MTENPFEPALVVVKPLQVFIVHSSDIHHYIAGIQRCRVSRSDQVCRIGVLAAESAATSRRSRQTCISVGRCLPEHVNGQGLIAMKCAVVRTDDLKDTQKQVNPVTMEWGGGLVTFLVSVVLSFLAGCVSCEADMENVRNCRGCKDLQPHLPNCANTVRPVGPRLISGQLVET